MEEIKKCFCGKPLHYSDPKLQRVIEGHVRLLGEYVKVSVGKRSWMVPRHYVALHGIKAVELPFLGFKEVK